MSHEDDFPDTQMDIELECPGCGAEVPYEEVGAPEQEGMAGCPVCLGIFPAEDWFG